ncbi:hypothetical protein DPX16_15596, partial [Anabarilius grahami]
ERSKARLPVDGPRGDFAAYVEWVLVNNESPFTICLTEESPTPDPEPSQPPPHPGQRLCQSPPQTRSTIALEPKPNGMSDQVRQPATSSVPVEFEGMDGALPTLLPLRLSCSWPLCNIMRIWKKKFPSPLFPRSSKSPVSPLVPASSKSPVSPLVPPSSKSPVSLLVPPSSKSPVSPLVPPSSKSPVSLKFLPSLPLPPPLPTPASSSAPSPLFPFSPSAPPLNLLCSMDLPWVFRSPAPPWQKDPLAPPPVTKPLTPPWLIDQSAPP